MKKYFLSILIPNLLLHLTGCYSMQKVTIDEFSQAPDSPELIVRSNNKEYIFNEGRYNVINDTIYGKGKVRLLNNPYNPFKGTISIMDVEDIQMNKSDNNSETSELLVKTKDREFIFKSELSRYLVKNDTIYGIGKYRLRNFDESFEYKVTIDINDIEEIQIDKFNLLNTILLSYAAITIVAIIIAALTSYVSIWPN